MSAEVGATILDATPPVISAVASHSPTGSSVRIAWTTNEASDSQVEFGPTTAYGSTTAVDAKLVESHSATLSGLAEATRYHYRVWSRDSAGNAATSADFTFTTVDLTDPSVLVTAPAPAATISGTVTLTADAADNVGVAGVQFQVNGVNAGVEDTTAPYATVWDTNTAADGTHTVTAIARDAAGNSAASGGVAVTVSNIAEAPASDPVAHWTLDETSGTTAADASGNGHTGTLVNGPARTTGRFGQALAFDGVTQSVRVESTAALNAYPFTLAFWLKTKASGGGVVTKYWAGSGNGYAVSMNAGRLCAWYQRDAQNYIWDGTDCSLATPGYADGLWHHVAFVVDHTGGRLYVDGAVTATHGWTGTAGAPTTTQPLYLGVYPGPWGNAYFAGAVDDVQILNRALTAGEVMALYAPTGVAYWTLDETSGLTAADASGNGHTGTLVNGPARTAGRFGQALAFDGATQSVRIESTAALNAYPFTLAFWLKTKASGGGVVTKYWAGSGNGYAVSMNAGRLCAWYQRDAQNYVWDGTDCSLATPGYADGLWHHVAFVVDQTGGRLYVDGAVTAAHGWAGTAGAPTTTQPLHFGVYPGPWGNAHFAGAIDDVRTLKRALSASEVMALYTGSDK